MPSLYFRVAPSEATLLQKSWDPLLQKTRRRWLDLFYNPHGNVLLFTDTLVRQFVDDVQAGDSAVQIEHAVSFKIVQNLVLCEIKKYASIESCFFYQFKVVMVPILADKNKKRAGEDLMISMVYRSE